MFWTHLAATIRTPWRRFWFGQPHIAFEFAWTGRDMDVRVWVPASIPVPVVQAAVTAAWPGALTATEPAPPPIDMAARCRGGAVRLTAAPAPVDTTAPADPARALITAGPSPTPSDATIVQVLARPAHPRAVARLRRTNTTGSSTSLAGMLLDLIQPGPTKTRTTRSSSHPEVTRLRRETADRAKGLMFETAVRYAVTTSKTGDKAEHALVARASAIAAGIGSLAGGSVKRARLPRAATVINTRGFGRGVLLTPAELSTLAHLPSDEVVPSLPRAGARPIAPATGIPSGGRGTKPLGTATVGGRKIALAATDARYHAHVVGPTGVGKSTFLLHMILADIKQHRGTVVIDPKGDLITDILNSLDPATVADRITIIDPAQPAPAIGIDPLAGADHDLVVDNLVSICRRIFERHWGPRADDILRHGLLTLLRVPGANLEHLPSLLSKKAFRAPYVSGIDEPWGLGGFWEWYDGLSPGIQSQAAGPVLSRIRALLGREFVRATIGAPRTSLDMGHILNHGGVLLARLPKGDLGGDTARLLGSIIVARTWQTTMARASTPEHQRRDASIYIDEAQNFLNLPRSLDDILAEARGLRLSMVLAHQYMAQLPRDMQLAVSANARTKVYFATSPEDARLLSRHTHPYLTEHDLAHLDVYQAACRTVTGGREMPPFTLNTLPPPPVVGQAETIRQTVRERAASEPSTSPKPKHQAAERQDTID
ncbi:TraM recognition domain-containing protein [Stackebrandtia endophytica]|nr:type IV secretory system conjugative DNA transfer family protein [Stackebrandtia endophytica]